MNVPHPPTPRAPNANVLRATRFGFSNTFTNAAPAGIAKMSFRAPHSRQTSQPECPRSHTAAAASGCRRKVGSSGVHRHHVSSITPSS